MSTWRLRAQRGDALIATVVLNTLVLVVLVEATLKVSSRGPPIPAA